MNGCCRKAGKPMAVVLALWFAATVAGAPPAIDNEASWSESQDALARLAEMPFRAEVTAEQIADGLAEVDTALDDMGGASAQALYLRAEAHRLAGRAFAVHAPAQAEAQRVAALDAAQDLRLTYRHQLVGQLGYIVEARIERDRERWTEADAVLTPVLEAAGRSREPAVMRIGLLADLERLEVLLARGATRDAVTDVHRLRPRYEQALGVHAVVPMRWFEARARTKLARTTGASRDRAAAAGALREVMLRGRVPEHERLKLLASLETPTDGRSDVDESGPAVMRPDERQAWAIQLARLGHDEQASAVFDRLHADDAATLSARAWATWGRVRWRLDELTAAADAFERALASDDDAIAADARARRRLRLAEVLQVALAQDSNDAALRERTAAALLAVADDPAVPMDHRGAALRQWLAVVEASAGSDNAEALAAALRQRADVVMGDVLLQHVQLSLRWQCAANVVAQGPAIAEALLAVRDAALADGQPTVAARAALLAATIYGHARIDRPRAALAALEPAWSAALASPDTARPAMDRRVTALLQLGLVDAAIDLVEQYGDDTTPSPTTQIALAAVLAGRYADAGNPARDKLRNQVSHLMNQALLTERLPAALHHRAAQAMLRVDLPAEARQLIEHSMPDDADNDQPNEADLRRRMLIVASLRAEGRHDTAVAEAAALVERYPRTSLAHLEHAASWRAVGDEQRAMHAYRAARRHGVRGDADWWDATLGLAETLDAAGESQAARQVLRVAATLYPVDEPPTLRQRIRAMQDRLAERHESTD